MEQDKYTLLSVRHTCLHAHTYTRHRIAHSTSQSTGSLCLELPHARCKLGSDHNQCSLCSCQSHTCQHSNHSSGSSCRSLRYYNWTHCPYRPHRRRTYSQSSGPRHSQGIRCSINTPEGVEEIVANTSSNTNASSHILYPTEGLDG